MLPSNSQDDPRAEQREYELARAYTAAQEKPKLRFRSWRFKAWLLFMLAPLAYAAIVPTASADLSAPWFTAWLAGTSGLMHILSVLFPGLVAGGQSIYGADPVALDDFLNFASFDLLCVLGALAVTLGMGPALRIVPKQGSAQLSFLQNIAKGFPVGKGRNRRRVGGPAGGIGFALLLVLLTLLPIYFFYIRPAMGDGGIFADAHYYCAASKGFGRHSHCIRYAENTLDQTLWKLGWMLSLATLLIPPGLWVGVVSLFYPIWLALGRPTRS